MKKDFYPDKTVCNCHIQLKSNYKKLQKCLLGYTVIANTDIKLLVSEMYRLSKSIHYKAQRMEKRLQKYRTSIEALGFKREK